MPFKFERQFKDRDEFGVNATLTASRLNRGNADLVGLTRTA